MSYKLDSTTIAPEIFDLPEMNNTKRSTKGKKSKGTGKGKGPATAPAPPGSSQEPQVSQSSQLSEPKQTGPSPILPESDFWKKPPGFCDVTLKDALAPIKRDGVEIPTAINESHVIRYAAAEIERINKTYREVKKEKNIDEDSMEGMSWYLGQEDSERRQAAAKRAKYAGNRKGKANGKVATLSQLRAAAAAAKVASNEQGGPSTVPPKNTGMHATPQNAQSKPASRHQPIPIDSGSDSESEYHDADCECGCVSASECSECNESEDEEETQERDAAAQTSSPRRPSLPGTSSEETDSNNGYEGSECGCEGEYCDSDCDFYPAEFYSSEVYFEVARSNAAAGTSASASASTPSGTQTRILPPTDRIDLVKRRLSSCMPIAEGSADSSVSDTVSLALRRSARLRATEGRGVSNPLEDRCAPSSDPVATALTSRHELDVGTHSPVAKRRRPASQDHYGPIYARRSSGERQLRPATLGQLALNPGGPAEIHFEYTPPAIRPGSTLESYQAEKAGSTAPSPEDKTRRGIEEIERQRMFLQTLLADHKKMEGQTEEILSRSPSSASSSQNLFSPVATSSPGPNFEDDDVLVVRRPSMPYPDLDITDPNVDVTRRPSLPDFNTASIEALNFADYDSDSDPWTFIQQATARDIMRSEHAGAEPPVEMLARLQKSSRREAFGLWRERLRSRQAEAATETRTPLPANLPPMRTSLPSRPRANQRTYTAKKKDAFSGDQAGISAKDRATAMKLQLEAVMGSPSLEALVEEQTSRASSSKQPALASITQAERDRASSRARAVLEAHFQARIQGQVRSESRASPSQQSSIGSHTTDENSQAARQEAAIRALALETARDFCAESERLEEQAFAEVRELALQARESGRFRPLRRAPTPVPMTQRGGGAELSKKLAASFPKSAGDFYGDHVPIEDKKKRIVEINEEIRVLSSGADLSSQRGDGAELSKKLTASVPKITPADFYAHVPIEDKKKRIADINEEIRILSSEAAKEARELASVGRAQLVAAGIDPKRIASIQAKYSECHSAHPYSHVHAATARNLRRKQKPYRTPDELFDLGWEGWTNLTEEEEKVKSQWEEDMRRKRNFKDCPLAWRAKRVEERSRTTFGCLLCVEGHLATF